MKKIILTSSFYDVADKLKFESSFGFKEGQTVAFFATAAVVETVDFYVNKAKVWFAENGFQVHDIDIDLCSPDALGKTLRKCDIIYVSGGNSFYLLQAFKRKGLDKLIRNSINDGKLYIGESAGSVILSPNIEYMKHMDDVFVADTLESYEAVSAIDFYTVPHYNNVPFKEAANTIIQEYKDELCLVVISNNQAMLVEGATRTLITNE